MEIFLDTCDIEIINKTRELLPIAGITTNPSILGNINLNELKAHINELVKLKIQVNLQVTGQSYEEMVEEGRMIAKLGENIIAKIPLNMEGMKAIKILSADGIKTNGTLCFSLFQAQIAIESGATYISPFIGRIESAGENANAFLFHLKKISKKTKILAASIRNLKHIELAIINEADAISIPPKLAQEAFKIDLLIDGEQKFKEAWSHPSIGEILGA